MKLEKNILIVFGTRPEAIKLAPVIGALRETYSSGHTGDAGHRVSTKVAITSQHRELVTPVLDFFGIVPDYDLDVMREDQTPTHVVERTLAGVDAILADETFDTVVVQGDTSSAVATALAAFYRKVSVAHVEAGLRSGWPDDPFPEEMNRRLITKLASLHFAPTERNRRNLLDEGVEEKAIVVTGNTVIDALELIANDPGSSDNTVEGLGEIGPDQRLILLTTHRRENFGERHRGIFEAVNQILDAMPDVLVAFPVHPNPSVRTAVERHLASDSRIRLLRPLDYISFVRLLSRAWIALTDSGGLQEEAPALGIPTLVLRETTERPEAIESGSAKLVGTSSEAIVAAVRELRENEEIYRAMAMRRFPFGDPGASRRIAERLSRRS